MPTTSGRVVYRLNGVIRHGLVLNVPPTHDVRYNQDTVLVALDGEEKPNQAWVSWLAPESAPTPPPLTVKGMCGGLWSAPTNQRAAAIAATGASHTREDVLGNFDQVLAAAKSAQLKVLPILPNGTDWTAWAQKYRGQFSHVELINEPFKNGPDPRTYYAVVKDATAKIKAVDPALKVLACAEHFDSGENGWGLDALDILAASGADKVIDGFSVHPYNGDPALPLAAGSTFRDTAGDWAFARIDTIHSRFPNLPVWVTEVGWADVGDQGAANVLPFIQHLGPALKARSWVAGMCYFGLTDTGGPGKEDTFGVYHADLTPKPALKALQVVFA